MQALDDYDYPFHLASEQENDCRECHESYYPSFVYRPKLVERNTVVRRDEIEYQTKCPHCGEVTTAVFVYYYD